MSATSGPTSRLPGSVCEPPPHQCCDEHQGVPAYKRITGEVDSFGAEYLDMCQECYDKYKAEVAAIDNSGTCDFCGTYNVVLRKFRDPEEGSCGRVYDVCHPCARESLAHFNEG